MFEEFTLSMIDTGEAVIRVRHGGSGPPLLLLHGHPQTHVMWHKLAPRLAQDFTVVAADLRGYGDSSKPPTTTDHAPRSEEHTSELQSRVDLVCRLLLEKKKQRLFPVWCFTRKITNRWRLSLISQR